MKRFVPLLLPALLAGCASHTAAPHSAATTAPAAAPPPVVTSAYAHYGDSITCGNYATDPAHSYAGLMDASVPGVSTNYCIQGGLSIDLSPLVYATADTLRAGDTSALMIGTNDVLTCGMGCVDNFVKALTGMTALLAMPPLDRIAARLMKQTGSWVNDEELDGSEALATSAEGSTLAFDVTTPVDGKRLFVAWKGTDGGAAGATVLVDGAVVGTLTAAGSSPVLTRRGTQSAVFAAAFPLGKAGVHAIRLAYTGQGPFSLEWAGVNTHKCVALGTPHLVLGTVPKQFQYGNTETQAFSDAVTEVAAVLRDEGVFVELADTHTVLGPDDFSDGWVHPNDAGHAKLANAFLHPAVPPAPDVAAATP